MINVAIVPFYFWVWYNRDYSDRQERHAIVPFYFWVWYNLGRFIEDSQEAIVPFYFWYGTIMFRLEPVLLML